MKSKIKEISTIQKLDREVLDKALKVRRMTRQDLADLMEVSRRSVQSWVNGVVPRGDRLKKLCKILDVSEKDLITRKYKITLYK